MGRHIETKKGLRDLLKRMESLDRENLEDYYYWHTCVVQCIEEGLAMDETDYENAPKWFRTLWGGLK